MKLSRRLGAAFSSLGIVAAALTIVNTTSAQADVVVPSVVYANPTESAVMGGGTLYLAGENLYGVSDVLFGTVAATEIYYASDTEIYVAIPPHPIGTVDLTVLLDPAEAEVPPGTTLATATAPYTTDVLITTTELITTDQTTGSTVLTTTYETVIPTTATTEYPVTVGVPNSLDPAAADPISGLISVPAGPFNYVENLTVTPGEGPTAGGSAVTIDSPLTESAFFLGCGIQPTGSLEIEDFIDMDVYFDDQLATDTRIVLGSPEDSEQFTGLKIKATTPAHAAGFVDVTVVFHGLCGEGSPIGRVSVGAAALPPFDDDDFVFSRANAYEYVAPSETTTVTTQTVTSAIVTTVTEVATQTVLPTTDLPTEETVDPTGSSVAETSTSAQTALPTTSTKPVLSATGTNSATVPLALTAAGLLVAGAILTLLGARRGRTRQH